ncbi:MAG TPA: hypothetical protein VN651_12530 [Gemmatimonadaceae bacterium]|nr:hypothetical protein [Gemmatimonadaceae bacterium]
MLRHRRTSRPPRGIVAIRRAPLARTVAGVTLAAALVAGCSHQTNPAPRRPPVPVHVINENFLDMNVSAVVGGVSRRLGDVTGNSTRDFELASPYGEPVSLTAVPIGGRGSYVSGALNVGYGQVIVLHIASSLRQSIAVLRDTL